MTTVMVTGYICTKCNSEHVVFDGIRMNYFCMDCDGEAKVKEV